MGPGVQTAGEGQEERGSGSTGQTREGPRRVREEWGEALGRGLRQGTQAQLYVPLVLGTLQTTNAVNRGIGQSQGHLQVLPG